MTAAGITIRFTSGMPVKKATVPPNPMVEALLAAQASRTSLKGQAMIIHWVVDEL